MSAEEQAKHCARVYLTEARTRRDSSFFWVVLGWAANARRRAVPVVVPAAQAPSQMDLFA